MPPIPGKKLPYIFNPVKDPTPPLEVRLEVSPAPGLGLPLQSGLSPWQAHSWKWQHGCGAEECSRARHRVLGRGTVPCDVLLLGEGPGVSEDRLGKPFVGQAGELLQRIIDDAIPASLKYAVTNIVACLPTSDSGDKSGEPTDEQVKCCMPRLVEFVEIANPRLLVCVGKIAEDWTSPTYLHRVKFHRDIPRVSITHPAAVLRQQVAIRGLTIQRCIVTISAACEELLK